jgi:hypothetical protein
VTFVSAQRQLTHENVDAEDDDPETTPKRLWATGPGASTMEFVLIDSAEGLESCVFWGSPSLDRVEAEDDDPETTPKAGAVPSDSWLRLSLPSPLASGGVSKTRDARKDLLWWLVGLAELANDSARPHLGGESRP